MESDEDDGGLLRIPWLHQNLLLTQTCYLDSVHAVFCARNASKIRDAKIRCRFDMLLMISRIR